MQPKNEEFAAEYGSEGTLDVENMGLFQVASMLSQNGDYMSLLFSLTGIYYLISGLTFWSKHYMLRVLLIDEVNASYIVSFTTLTATTIGCIVSGVVNAALGGVQTRNAKIFSLIAAWACVPCVLPIPFIKSTLGYAILNWLLLFFGAVILPSQYGLMIKSVQRRELRASANSLAQLSFNALGLMPAPAIYGAIASLVDGQTL